MDSIMIVLWLCNESANMLICHAMSIPAAQNVSKLAVEDLENNGNLDLEKQGSGIAKGRKEALSTKRKHSRKSRAMKPLVGP